MGFGGKKKGGGKKKVAFRKGKNQNRIFNQGN